MTKKNEDEYFYLNNNDDFEGDDSDFSANTLELELRKKEE